MRQPSKPVTKADNPRLRMVRIDIGGDTELGLWVKNVLDSIDWRSQLKLY